MKVWGLLATLAFAILAFGLGQAVGIGALLAVCLVQTPLFKASDLCLCLDQTPLFKASDLCLCLYAKRHYSKLPISVFVLTKRHYSKLPDLISLS